MLNKLKQMKEDFISAADVAPLLGVHPQSIRSQAQSDSSKLGFPVSVIGRRVRIPRAAFINWLEGAKK